MLLKSHSQRQSRQLLAHLLLLVHKKLGLGKLPATQIENTCPLCKVRFRTIERQLMRKDYR